jgi:hypothetical protein
VYALASSNPDPLIGGVSVAQVLESPLGSNTTFRITLSGLNANAQYACKAYVTDTDGVTYYSPVTTFSTNLTPTITSNGGAANASVSVAENSSAVSTVIATDADAGQAISYSITGGADAARFAIDSSTGALTFATAPNFEAPADANVDNVYEVIVAATDNGNPPKSATQTLTVTVTNIADSGEIAVEQPAASNVATGGYNGVTGEGSRAVEFVATSITSPGLDDPTGSTAGFLRSVNPHFKFIDFNQRGYMLLDVTPARTVCEWWTVDTVASVSNVQTFATAFEVAHGSNRLQPSAQNTPPANVPPLAP